MSRPYSAIRQQLLRAGQRLLVLAIVVMTGLLAWRGLHGPYLAPVRVVSPIQLEGWLGLSILLLAFWRARPQLANFPAPAPGWLLLPLLLVPIGFVCSWNIPFLADDYFHLWNAQHAGFASLREHFIHADSDHFFRPLVYVVYAAEFQLAGLHPAIWHLLSITIHLANVALVFFILRALPVAKWPSVAGASLFAVYGGLPESVTWMAAQFDLLAAFFGLAALFLLLQSNGARSFCFHALSCIALVFALLSKESAYAVPLIAVPLLLAVGFRLVTLAKKLIPWFVLSAVVFVYRYWVLHGIGGYQQNSFGTPIALQFRLPTFLKAITLRLWAVFWTPLNWSNRPAPFVVALLVLSFAGLTWLAWRSPRRRELAIGLAVIIISCLPVFPFLTFNDDLSRARVLYLPCLGLAILFSGLTAGLQGNRQAAAIIAVLCFQIGALQHNLHIWRSTGMAAQSTCQSAVELFRHNPSLPFAVPDLPESMNGVYFLHTGFPECVWLLEPKSVSVVSAVPASGSRIVSGSELQKGLH